MNAMTTETFMDTNLPLFANLPHKVQSLDADTVRFGNRSCPFLSCTGFSDTADTPLTIDSLRLLFHAHIKTENRCP